MELFGNDERMKRCSRCGQYKTLSEFNLHTDTPILHRQSYCRQCQREYAREHSTGSCRSVASSKQVSEAQRNSYNELYARYKAYKMYCKAYIDTYGDNPEERMSFELSLGL